MSTPKSSNRQQTPKDIEIGPKAHHDPLSRTASILVQSPMVTLYLATLAAAGLSFYAYQDISLRKIEIDLKFKQETHENDRLRSRLREREQELVMVSAELSQLKEDLLLAKSESMSCAHSDELLTGYLTRYYLEGKGKLKTGKRILTFLSNTHPNNLVRSWAKSELGQK